MEVVHHRLVAGNRLEDVAVRVRHHRLSRGFCRVGRDQVVHRHALHRAGRRVVQREVLDVLLHFLALGLADAHAELRVSVFPVPDVSEVGVDFAREEEHVRRREGGDRSIFSTAGDEHAVLRLHRHARVVLEAAELILLRIAAAIAPRHTRREGGREPFQAAFVLVCDRLLVGLRDRFHAKQVRPAVRREPQASRENAHRQSGEVDLDSRAVGGDAARARLELRVCGSNFFRLAR